MNPFLNQNVIYYKLSDNFEASSLDPINMALGQSRCVCVCMCVCVDIEEVAWLKCTPKPIWPLCRLGMMAEFKVLVLSFLIQLKQI